MPLLWTSAVTQVGTVCRSASQATKLNNCQFLATHKFQISLHSLFSEGEGYYSVNLTLKEAIFDGIIGDFRHIRKLPITKIIFRRTIAVLKLVSGFTTPHILLKLIKNFINFLTEDKSSTFLWKFWLLKKQMNFLTNRKTILFHRKPLTDKKTLQKHSLSHLQSIYLLMWYKFNKKDKKWNNNNDEYDDKQ